MAIYRYLDGDIMECTECVPNANAPIPRHVHLPVQDKRANSHRADVRQLLPQVEPVF